MPPVLLLEVANLIVELLEVVAEGCDFVLGGPSRILETHDVLVALLHHFLLVSDPVLLRLNLRLHAID